MKPRRAAAMALTVGIVAMGTMTARGASGSPGAPWRPLTLELGLRGGAAHATGAWADYRQRPWPFTAEASLGLGPNLTVGPFFRWVRARAAGDLAEICSDCDDRTIQTGLQGRWRVVAGPVAPWLGAGFGYQWFKSASAKAPTGSSPDSPLRTIFVKDHGLAVLVQTGVDVLIGSRFRIGPYLGWSTAWQELAWSETFLVTSPRRSSFWEAGLGATFQLL